MKRTRVSVGPLLTGLFFAFFISAQSGLAQQRTNTPAPTTTANDPIPNNRPTAPPTGSQLGNYRNEQADNWIPLEASKRQVIVADLQPTVAELLELYHDAKQSHWNLRGPLYLSLHEALQGFADLFLDQSDLIAERVLQIGQPVDGRPDVLVQTAGLPRFPGGYLSDRQVLALMDERVNTIAIRVRQRVESTSKNGDEVSSNKLQDLSYQLDKIVWKLRVMQQ